MGAFDTLITYDKGTYIETDTGSATNIILGGKSIIQTGMYRPSQSRFTETPGAILRGDLRRSAAGQHVVISMGRYCVIGEGSIIRPPGKIYKGAFTFYPVRIADFVDIGSGCIVEAASIGHGVEIGKGSIIGKFAIIKDLAVILPGTVLPDGAIVPSMTVWSGNPETVEAKGKSYYQRFRAA
ncbi:dynactin 5, partial [Tremellales sp. Uapishka_1]